MSESKWHNISIKTESFKEIREIQKTLPIRSSVPQTIEYLIELHKALQKATYENNTSCFDLVYAHKIISTKKGEIDE